MRHILGCVALASALTLAAAGNAEEAAPAAAPAAAAPAVKTGAHLKTSDGKRLGRIERLITSKDGNTVLASVIYDSRFVYVPVSTITASDRGFVTSLTRAEVSKLK